MTEEIKTEEKECKCFCQSKDFRKFLTIALGTFIGVYCALSLFAALHKPPMAPPCAFYPHSSVENGYQTKMLHHHFRGDKPNFHHPGKRLPAPFEVQRKTDKD